MDILKEVEVEEEDSLLYEEALELLKEFEAEQKPSKVKLLNSAEKLTESVKHNQHHAKSYFLLAYIFYLLNDDKLAEKYLNVAKDLEIDKDRFKKLSELLHV